MKLDELPGKDAVRIQKAQELEKQQRDAVIEIHARCGTLVAALNRLLDHMELQLSPDTFDASQLFEAAETLFQINAAGRIVQIVVLPPPIGPTTEHFYIPYILEARIRWFNQEALDREQIPEHHLYFCAGRNGETGWKYFDPRSRRVGSADEDYLAETIEQLV